MVWHQRWTFKFFNFESFWQGSTIIWNQHLTLKYLNSSILLSFWQESTIIWNQHLIFKFLDFAKFLAGVYNNSTESVQSKLGCWQAAVPIYRISAKPFQFDDANDVHTRIHLGNLFPLLYCAPTECLKF